MSSNRRQKKILKKKQKQQRRKMIFRKRLKQQRREILKVNAQAEQDNRLTNLLYGRSFPYFPKLLLLKYLSWKDFVNLRLVCAMLYNIVDSHCDEKWMQFFQRTYPFLVPVSENEWNIFFPTARSGCFRDLTLEVLKVLRLTVEPVILEVPEIGIRPAETIEAYPFPWYFVCKYLELPIGSEICHDFDALRLTESYVRLNSSELADYQQLCVGEFLKKYVLKEKMTISFISRRNPNKVQNFKVTELPIKQKDGPIAQLVTDLPEMVTSFSGGRQLAFTLFVHELAQTFDIWLSRLNANPDLVEQHQKQLSDYCSRYY